MFIHKLYRRLVISDSTGLVLSDNTWLLISDSTFSKFRKFWSKISDYGLKNLQNFGHISDPIKARECKKLSNHKYRLYPTVGVPLSWHPFIPQNTPYPGTISKYKCRDRGSHFRGVRALCSNLIPTQTEPCTFLFLVFT